MFERISDCENEYKSEIKEIAMSLFTATRIKLLNSNVLLVVFIIMSPTKGTCAHKSEFCKI